MIGARLKVEVPVLMGFSIEKYEADLRNRMSSGTYFPQPVMAVEIPKKSGGVRVLGIPTVEDRIAQMVAKLYIESRLDSIFLEVSYGYRPHKSALDAVGRTRTRCWDYDYVVDLDIKGLFDNIDHDLLMKAVKKHVSERWILLYIERWLKTPFQSKDGLTLRTAGTPQGGVISPVLSNLFMHYAFDIWMQRNYPNCPFERYADDTVVHCKTEKQAKFILGAINRRMDECRLQLHPVKTKIVYCKDDDRRKEYGNTEFNFLGYCFKGRYIKDRLGRKKVNFIAGVSKESAKAFRTRIKELEIHKKTGSKIEMIAELLNPMLRGWINYFGRYNKSDMRKTLEIIQNRIVKWAMCKFKRFRGRQDRARKWLDEVRSRQPKLFVHWTLEWKL